MNPGEVIPLLTGAGGALILAVYGCITLWRQLLAERAANAATLLAERTAADTALRAERAELDRIRKQQEQFLASMLDAARDTTRESHG